MSIHIDSTPFYKKLAYILISIICIGHLAVLAKELLSPLIFSILFSIVLLPWANFMENKWKLPRGIAVLISLILFITIISISIYLIISQMTRLADDWPLFQKQLNDSLNKLQHWISSTYHINTKKQLGYLENAKESFLSSSTVIIGTTVLSVSSILLFLVFTTIDTFFLLLYRRLILRFLVSVFKEENEQVVLGIVKQVQYILRNYIIGLLLEMVIVAAIVCAAFSILGVKYSILLGILTGIFNLVPYIGIFTALLISVLITFATAATTTKIFLVAVIVIVVHLIDSNILLPLIVGSKVKINALITILGVIIGEMLWGISGMFLSIPVIAVSKIIFDRIESLQPWGMLLGEENKNNPKTVINDE